ncbi:hypothetical protein [Nitratifractor sp.]
MYKKSVMTLLAAALSVNFLYATPPEPAVDIVKHLEFLGYKATMDSNKIKATHPKYFNIFLKKFRGGILVTAYYGATSYAASHRGKFLELVNKLNQEATAGRYYLDKDGDLAIEGYYPGTYRRTNFGTFLEAFNEERNHLVKHIKELEPFLK